MGKIQICKKSMSENNESFLKNKYLGWGLGAIGGIAGLYFLYNNKFKAPKHEYDLEQVRDVLREFHKEFYVVYTMIAGDIKRMHQSVAQQTGMFQLTPEIKAEVKQVFMQQSTWLRTDIEAIEEKLMAKHNMNKEDYQTMVDVKYKDKREIVNKRNEIEASFEKAFDGILPAMDPTIIPETFKAEHVLEVYRDTIEWQLNYIVNEAIRIKQKGDNCTETNMEWIMA